MRIGSEILPQQEDPGDTQIERQPSWELKIMIGSLYFAQGFVYSIAGTVPYTYQNLPDYFTLGLFSLCTIPFSFKFATAPLLQKYTNLDYGKRKTWIIINQTAVSLFILLSSFYTGQNQAQKFAFLLFPIYLGLSMQDIALDALCLKELIDPKLMSLIQAACQTTGSITGGVVLLKGTSEEFSQKIGLSHPITSLQTILICISILILVQTIIIHFTFTETKLETDERATRQPIVRVYSIYKYFLDKQYRYFRIMVFLLLYHQGLNFFQAGFAYQLVQSGFSRDILNTIDNAQNLFGIFLVFMFGMYATHFGFKTSFIIQMSCLTTLYTIFWIFFPTSVVAVCGKYLLAGLLSQWGSLLRSNLCAYFPELGATGMLYTMGASISNLGRNTFIHSSILKKVPWRTASIAGLALTVPIIVFFIPGMMDLIEQGETKIEFEVSETYIEDAVENNNEKSEI